MAGGLKKGCKRAPGTGRKKGTPNKVTSSIKNAFKEAFEEMGGAAALMKWGKDNPTDFYKLASKLIPTEVQTSVEGSLTVVVSCPPPNSEPADD